MVIGITGATGFVGRHVIHKAVAAGHEVVAFSRNPAAAIPGAREVRGWGRGASPDVSALEGVIHLAGEPVLGLWTQSKRQAILDSRVEGTRQLVAALQAANPRPATLLCASAIGYYGDRGDEWLSEDSPPGRGFLAGVTRAWEAEALAARNLGVRVACARLGLVLGPDGGTWPLLRKVFRAGLGGRLGSGRQWMSWVHIDDVAGLLLAALGDARYDGPFNVVGPAPVTNADLTRSVARVLHRPAFVSAPSAVLRLLLREQAVMFLGSQRVLPQLALERGYRHVFATLDAALGDLAGT